MFRLPDVLNSVIVAQKRTGKHKKFVFLLSDVVAKGPYSKDQFEKILTRSTLLQNWNSNYIVHPSGYFEADGYYLYFPNFLQGYVLESEPHKETFSSYSYNILKNSPTISLKDALIKDKSLWKSTPQLIYDLCLLHLLGVGDCGHRNIQVDVVKQKIYVIDFDEDLGEGNYRDDEEFYFSRPSAKALKWIKHTGKHYRNVANKLELLRENEYVVKFGLLPGLERILILLRKYSVEEVIHPQNSLGQMVWKGLNASKTYSGVDFDVAKSALQKWIRRGEVEKALMIATEMFRFSEIEGADAAVTNLYNRLAIIANEDIGPANLPLVLEITDIVENGKRNYYELLAMVQLMCQSSKTRIMSHLYYVYVALCDETQKYSASEYPSCSFLQEGDPNFANEFLGMAKKCLSEKNFSAFTWIYNYKSFSLDCEISKRKKFHKGNNKTGKPDILIWYLLREFLPEETHDILVKAYYNHTENRPFLSCALTAILFNRVAEKGCRVQELAKCWSSSETVNLLLEGNYSLVVDDYAIDKHTKKGREMGKNTKNFVEEGALVNNQDPELFDERCYNLYAQRN